MSEFKDKRPQHCNYRSVGGVQCRKTSLNNAGYCKKHSAKKYHTTAHKIIQEVKKSFKHTFAIGSRSFSPLASKRLDYHEYILSADWKHKADLEKQNNPKCSLCNRKRPLHVHHRTYVRLGNEIPGDLIVLCDECHEIFHMFYEYDGRVGHFIKK